MTNKSDFYWNRSDFNRMGAQIQIISAGDGRCVGEFKIEPEHGNTRGTLHGGMTATLVDIMTGYACFTTESGRTGVTIDLHVSYLSAAKIGETIIIDAKVAREGKKLAFTTAEIRKKADGKLVALATHTVALPPLDRSTEKSKL